MQHCPVFLDSATKRKQTTNNQSNKQEEMGVEWGRAGGGWETKEPPFVGGGIVNNGILAVC